MSFNLLLLQHRQSWFPFSSSSGTHPNVLPYSNPSLHTQYFFSLRGGVPMKLFTYIFSFLKYKNHIANAKKSNTAIIPILRLIIPFYILSGQHFLPDNKITSRNKKNTAIIICALFILQPRLARHAYEKLTAIPSINPQCPQ